MMEMLDISIPNSNPHAGRGQSLTLPPSLMKQVFPREERMAITSRPNRRTAASSNNASKARADGFYMRGKIKYKLRKGSPLPTRFDEIFYYGEKGVEREEVLTPADVVAARLAAEDVADEDQETTAEDGGESPEKPKRTGRRRKAQAE